MNYKLSKADVIQAHGFNFIFDNNNEYSDGPFKICKVKRESLEKNTKVELTGVVTKRLKTTSSVTYQISLSTELKLSTIPDIHCFFRTDNAIFIVYQNVNMDKSLCKMIGKRKLSPIFLQEILRKIKEFATQLDYLGFVLLRLDPRMIFEENGSILIFGLPYIVRKDEPISSARDDSNATFLGDKDLDEYPPEVVPEKKNIDSRPQTPASRPQTSSPLPTTFSSSQTTWAIAYFLKYMSDNCEDISKINGFGFLVKMTNNILECRRNLEKRNKLEDYLKYLINSDEEISFLRESIEFKEELEKKKGYVKLLMKKCLVSSISKINISILKILVMIKYGIEVEAEIKDWLDNFGQVENDESYEPQMKFLVERFKFLLIGIKNKFPLNDDLFELIRSLNTELIKEGSLKALHEPNTEKIYENLNNLISLNYSLEHSETKFESEEKFKNFIKDKAEDDISRLKVMTIRD